MIEVLTGVGMAALSWVTLNFLGKPILTLREKRREALEFGERWAYVGLYDVLLIGDDGLGSFQGKRLSDDQQKAFVDLHGAGNSLRAHCRERALATQIYCWVF